MKKALLALAMVGLVAGVAALPSQAAGMASQAADMAGQATSVAAESSGAMNNAPSEFPGEVEFSVPPSFMKDLLPQQTLQNVPGWLFG